jgi:asparagine synthase (glutamine-hydrolysing)
LAEAIFAECLAGAGSQRPLQRMLYADTKLWLPDFLLLRGDKLSMAHSLEARVPLLDHKLAEFAAALPPRFKLRGFTRKYLLRKVAARYLPREILDRPKQGFPIPLSQWLRRELRTFARDLLAPETIRRRGLFDSSYVLRLLNEHESGFADHGLLLWGLMSLELWHQRFVDSPVSASAEFGLASAAPAPS